MDRKETTSKHAKSRSHFVCEHCGRALSIDEIIECFCTSCQRKTALVRKQDAA